MLRLLLVSTLALHARAFCWECPPGPQFTAAEKAEQLKRGATVLPTILSAFNSGAQFVTLPPGDYRWADTNASISAFQLEIANLQRTADSHFTIYGYGVTFWFSQAPALPDPSAPPDLAVSFGLHILNCSHIGLHGVTLDSDPRGTIEGRVTAVDRIYNRFQFALSAGSAFAPVVLNKQSHNEIRFLPFTASGAFSAPLYAFQRTRGLYLSNLTALDAQGRSWASFENTLFLQETRDARWAAAYGDAGAFEPGHGVAILIYRMFALVIENSAEVVISDVTNHVTKGDVHTTLGDGGHVFRNYVSGPRPGTNQLTGGEGFMIDAGRRGPTLDNVSIMTTTDDTINFHAYWAFVDNAVGAHVNFVANGQFNPRSVGAARSGDTVNFFDAATMALIASGIVARVVSSEEIILERPIAGLIANSVAFFPDNACAGWAITNSQFVDNYQRVFVQTGPGSFVNNTVLRSGSGLHVSSSTAGFEGGMPSSILIANNTFIDTAPMPIFFNSDNAVFPIIVGDASNILAAQVYGNITIVNNTIVRSGGNGIVLVAAADSVVVGNTVADPLVPTALIDAGSNLTIPFQAIYVAYSSNVRVAGNALNETRPVCKPDAQTGSKVLGLGPHCHNVSVSD